MDLKARIATIRLHKISNLDIQTKLKKIKNHAIQENKLKLVIIQNNLYLKKMLELQQKKIMQSLFSNNHIAIVE